MEAETLILERVSAPRVNLWLHSQTGQMWSTGQWSNQVGKIWSKSQGLVKGKRFNCKYWYFLMSLQIWTTGLKMAYWEN